MKKLFFLGVLLCSIGMNSQVLGYNDLGALFTQDYNYGTARSRAMGGAFGSLGGDMSSLAINPAGAAVFLRSEFAATYSYRESAITSNYYGVSTFVNSNYNDLSQIGGVFIFKTGGSNWSKTAIGFNYNVANSFDNRWVAQGNSNYPTFIYDDEGNEYLNSYGQYFDNYTSGSNDKYTFTFASQYSDKLYVGASFTTNDIRFYQNAYLEEDNYDDMGNTLLGTLEEDLAVFGSGFSFNIGLISKPSDAIRIGLSYQSPVWYDLNEEYSSSETDWELNGYRYSMRTPSKTTGSLAFIFSRSGLISLDYVYRNYSNIQLSPEFDFSEENRIFSTDYRATSEIRLGTEWRFKKLSLRGGYHYEQSPYNEAPTELDLEGFSVGMGINFGPVRFDVSFEESQKSSTYNFYPQYTDVIDPAYLEHRDRIFTASLIFNL